MADIIINAILQAKPGKETFLREELVKVIAPSRAEDGCIQYTLHEDINKKIHLFFMRDGKTKKLSCHTLKRPIINITEVKRNNYLKVEKYIV